MADKILSFRIDVQGVSKEAQEIARLESSLEKLNEERRESQRLLKQGQITRKQYESSLAKIRSKQADLRAERTRLNKVEATAAKQYKAGAGSINALRIRMQQLRNEMSALNLETKDGQAKFKRLNAEYQKGTQRLRNFDRQMSGSKTLVGEYGRGIKGAFTSLAIGITAGVAGFRTLQRAIQSTTKDLAEFEKGQANVQTLLDQYNDTLASDTLRLTKQYGLEIADVNKALFDAVSAGVPAERAISFLDDAAKLAIGGVTDLSVAVDGITSVLNGYGLAASEANRVAAAFFSAQKFGKTTVAELSAEIGKVVPIAKQLDVTYQEVLATFAETTKQGIATTESATAIKNIMVALLKPTKEAADKFDDLGIAYGANRVSQEGFLNVFKQVITAVNEGDAELAELIPNIRALTGAGALGTEQLKELDEILKVVNEDYGEGSSLARALATQQDTLAQSLERISARFAAARINIGKFFAPLIKGFADLISPTEKASAALRREQIELNNLVKASTQANITLDARAAILEQINGLNPAFLEGLDTEKVTTEELAERLNVVNELYAQKIALIQIEELQTETAKDQNDLLLEEIKLRIELEDEIARQAEKQAELDAVTERYGENTTAAKQAAFGFALGLQDSANKQEELNQRITDNITEQQRQESIFVRAANTIQERANQLAASLQQSGLQNLFGGAGAEAPATPTPGPGGKLPEVKKVIEQTTVRFTSEEADIYKTILADIDQTFTTYAEDAEKTNEALFQNQLNRWNEETRQYQLKEEKKRALTQATNQIIDQGLNFLFARNNKLREEELAAAGDNEAKKEEIRKKYAKREQRIAISEAIIKSGLIVLNALQTQPFIPAGLIASVVGAATAAIQIATIKQQSFASGGQVQPGSEIPGAPRGGDNTMIMAKPGEVVLNAQQQNALGGASTFKKIGVPGFASGGVVGVTAPQPGTGSADLMLMTRSLAKAWNDKRIVLDVNELNAANDDLDVINTTNPL